MITAAANQLKIAGPEPAIASILIDGQLIDFTAFNNSLDDINDTLTMSVSGGLASELIVEPVVAPLPTLTLVANDTTADAGQTITFTAASNVSNITFASEDVTLSGTGLTRTAIMPSLPNANTVTVTATATNADGVSVSESVVVSVAALSVPVTTTKRVTFDVPTLAQGKQNTRWFVFSETLLMANGTSNGLGATFEVDLDDTEVTNSQNVIFFATNRFTETIETKAVAMADIQPVIVEDN